MKSLQHILTEVSQFIRQPQYLQPLALSNTSGTIRQFSAESPIVLTLAGVSAATMVGLSAITGNGLTYGITTEGSTDAVLVAGAVLIPMLTESIFRTPMRLTPNRLGWLSFIVGLFLIGSVLKPIEARLGLYAGSWLVSGWAFLGPLTAWFITRPARYARIERGWRKHFGVIFYVLTVLYALSFASELDLSGWQLLLLPIALVPGLLAGFYLGYVRMKYGYWYAVLVSGLMNVVPLLIAVGKLG